MDDNIMVTLFFDTLGVPEFYVEPYTQSSVYIIVQF
jgi:hypothetical protein